MNYSNDFAQSMARVRFGTSDKAKINKQVFTKDLEAALVAGQMNILDRILKDHDDLPFKSVDEFLGHIQILLVDNFNYAQSKLSMQQFRRASVEDVINGVDYNKFKRF